MNTFKRCMNALFVLAVFFSLGAVLLQAQQIQALHVALADTSLTAEVAKREYFVLLDRVIAAEEEAAQVLCKLSMLEEEYTGCGGGPVDEPDGWGFDDDYGDDQPSDDLEDFDDDETDTLGQALSDFWQTIKVSGGLFDDPTTKAMSQERGE